MFRPDVTIKNLHRIEKEQNILGDRIRHSRRFLPRLSRVSLFFPISQQVLLFPGIFGSKYSTGKTGKRERAFLLAIEKEKKTKTVAGSFFAQLEETDIHLLTPRMIDRPTTNTHAWKKGRGEQRSALY